MKTETKMEDGGLKMENVLPLTWAEYKFPRWMPKKVREELKEFWAESFGRSPREWMRSFDYAYASHPRLGEWVSAEQQWGCGIATIRFGRYVPMWNNIARLVNPSGQITVISSGDVLRVHAPSQHFDGLS